MQRMTERDEFKNADIIGVDSETLCGNLSFDEMNLVTAALNRLAAYAGWDGRFPPNIGDDPEKEN